MIVSFERYKSTDFRNKEAAGPINAKREGTP